jgi:peptidoglycan hydrolase-like protein with peptidoglycan-binding domain
MMPPYVRLLVALWCTSALLEAYVSGVSFVDAARTEAQPQTAQSRSSDFIKSLQRELKRAGYDPGVADGRMGPSTQRAIKRFQEAHSLPPTGDPDIPTLTKLLGRGLPP